MNEKNPGGELQEETECIETIRTKLAPLVHALARTAARDWLDKVANDNSTQLTQNKPAPEQE